MLSADIIQKLKRTNISADAEKTMQRVKELWKTASGEEKDAVEKSAGVTRPTVARVYGTGSISVKLAVPIAQTLNVSPFYLTGESDEQGECTEESLAEFLKEYGYEELLAEQARMDKKLARKNRARPEQPKETEAEIEERFDREMRGALEKEAEQLKTEWETGAGRPDPDTQTLIETMTEEDLILLMRAVLLRAKAGGKHAELALQLKLLLLS